MCELMVSIQHGNCFSIDQRRKTFAMQNHDRVKFRVKQINLECRAGRISVPAAGSELETQSRIRFYLLSSLKGRHLNSSVSFFLTNWSSGGHFQTVKKDVPPIQGSLRTGITICSLTLGS